MKYFLSFILIFLLTNLTYSWDGIDMESRTQIEIESGNLVRDGLYIEFFDWDSNQYHDAQIISLEEDENSSRIILNDITLGKNREFIMK